MWQAIRENEQRVEVLGLRPFSFKLIAFVLASFLATAGGVVYLLLIGGSTPEVTTASFTLTLLLMVVIGGTGTRWGAVIGGVLYTYLDNRLLAVAGSNTVQDLPGFLRTPLSEPLFVLGVIFILIVYFFPGGIVGLSARGRGEGPAPNRVRGRPARASRGGRMSVHIAWERRGEGPPLLLIQGLGYARWGWEPVVPPARALVRRDPLRQPRHRRERRAAGPVHDGGHGGRRAPGAGRGRRRPRPRARDEPRRHDRAGAGAGAPERVDRLVLACTTPGGPRAHPMPAATVELMLRRASLREFTENSFAPAVVPELVDRILVHREAEAQG